MKVATNAIIADKAFWEEVEILIVAFEPLLELLRLGDMNSPSMDGVVYAVRQFQQHLKASTAFYSGEYQTGQKLDLFQWRKDVHGTYLKEPSNTRHWRHAMGKPDTVKTLFKLHDYEDESDNEGETDSDSESDTSEISGNFDFNEIGQDQFEDEDEEIEDYTFNLGNKMVEIFEKRMSSMQPPIAKAAFLCCADPAVMDMAKDYVEEDRADLRECVKKLLHPASENEMLFENTFHQLLEQLRQFHKREDHYAQPRIWEDPRASIGRSHEWHIEHSRRFGNILLGDVAARVCSKPTGSGAAERPWKDLKRISTGQRKKMMSDRKRKQATCVQSHSLLKNRLKKPHMIPANIRRKQDDGLNAFRDMLKSRAVNTLNIARKREERNRSSPNIIDVDELFRTESGYKPNRAFRVFYEQEVEGLLKSKEDIRMAKVLKKYGGLYFVNPDYTTLYRIHSKQIHTAKGKVHLILLAGDQEEEDNLKLDELETWPLNTQKNVEDAVSCVAIADNDNVDHFDTKGNIIDIKKYRKQWFALIKDWSFVEKTKNEMAFSRYKKHKEGKYDKKLKSLEKREAALQEDTDDDNSYATK